MAADYRSERLAKRIFANACFISCHPTAPAGNSVSLLFHPSQFAGTSKYVPEAVQFELQTKRKFIDESNHVHQNLGMRTNMAVDLVAVDDKNSLSAPRNMDTFVTDGGKAVKRRCLNQWLGIVVSAYIVEPCSPKQFEKGEDICQICASRVPPRANLTNVDHVSDEINHFGPYILKEVDQIANVRLRYAQMQIRYENRSRIDDVHFRASSGTVGPG